MNSVSSLKVGDRVRVKSEDWFKENFGFSHISSKKVIIGGNNYFLSPDSGIKNFFNKEVTIKRIYIDDDNNFRYKILEDNESNDWLDIFFDEINPKLDIIHSINKYCNDLCIYSNCKESSCCLYKYLSGGNTCDLKIGDTVRVKPLKWFEAHCTLSKDGYYMLPDTSIIFVSDMKKYCDTTVTIKEIIYLNMTDVICYKIKEDCCTYAWVNNFFINPYNSISISSSIRSFCRNKCALRESPSILCTNSECPLYGLA